MVARDVTPAHEEGVWSVMREPRTKKSLHIKSSSLQISQSARNTFNFLVHRPRASLRVAVVSPSSRLCSANRTVAGCMLNRIHRDVVLSRTFLQLSHPQRLPVPELVAGRGEGARGQKPNIGGKPHSRLFGGV